MDKKYCPYCMNPVREGETCKNCGLTEGVYTPRDHHLPLGTVLNHRYLVGRVLGEGGFGITYIGCDLNLELKVAIKEYFPIDRVYRFSKTSLQVSNYAHAEEKYQSGKVKFLREARTMARLDKQQNIVSVRDFFEENDTAYIVMEYVEGTTLKELVSQRGGRIPAGELLHMLEPLFPALTSIHELGLIHRDISPDNLMLENGKIKLLDFGCARESAAQSETMTIALKQGYAPIEQYQHKGQGPWTDVYALSATIYYCLTGKTPQSAVDRLSEEELISPRKLGVDLTASQEAALLHGMNVKAKDRFQSAEELYAALYMNVMPVLVSEEANFAPNEPAPVPSESTSAPNGPIPAQGMDLNRSARSADHSPDRGVPSVDNKTVVFDSAGELSLPEMEEEGKAPAESGIKKAFGVLKQRRNLMILAGSAVLLAAVIGIVVAVALHRDSEAVIAPGPGEPGGGTVSGEGPQPENQSDPGYSADAPEELGTAESLFADAAVLEAYTEEELRRLMEDDTVSAIRIPEASSIGEGDSSIVSAGLPVGAVTVTKPVLVERDAFVDFFNMVTVRGENACLWVEGDLGVHSILQTMDGGRIVADNPKHIAADILWLEEDADVRVLDGEYPEYEDLVIGGKNTLFQNAVSVSNEAMLRQAVSEGQAVVISSDFAIVSEMTFPVPVMIKEGVTVEVLGSGVITVDGKDAFLWNEGKIQGGILQINSDTNSANYGEISDGTMVVNGFFANLGDIATIGDVYEFDGQSRLYNIGTMRCQAETDVAFRPNLFNFGSVTFYAAGDAVIGCDSTIENRGEIRVENGPVRLMSYLFNGSMGQILICDNAALYNQGVIEIFSGFLECESGGNLINDEGAVYYLYGRPEFELSNGWSHVANIDPAAEGVCEVTNADELTDALKNPEVNKICLTGEISWNEQAALTLTKEAQISAGAELRMEEGSELIVDGCYLENQYGYLSVDHLTLTHGGSFYNEGGTVELYSADSVIKLGNAQGENRYDGTDCLLNMGYIRYGGRIELYDDALMIQKGELLLEEPVIQISDHAYFANMGEMQWRDRCSIEISRNGQFRNLLRQDWFQGLTMRIAEGGTFCSLDDLIIQSGDISVGQDGKFEVNADHFRLGNNLTVSNDGYFLICGGGDAQLLQGYFKNHGVLHIANSGLVIDTPSNTANTACLDNQGEVRITGPEGYVRTGHGEFIGNEANYWTE